MKLFKTIALMMVLSSCAKKEVPEVPPTFNNPNWTRIEIANGREAHAVYGSIDDTLMVSTLTEIYQTTDKGKTWQKTKVNHQPIYGFLAVKDTIFALQSNSLRTKENLQLATFSQYFSLDKGFTWDWCSKFNISEQRFQEFATVYLDDQVKVKLKENLEPIVGSSMSSYVLKSDIEVFKNGFSEILKVPFENQINNVHVDKSGKLYVSAGRGIHDKKTGKYLSAEKSEAAIIYISKKNVQQLID
ncbi:hypothetical protein SRABI27_03300 [Pedobacter sp. Bi27]|uniref:hypothetical protein n=1 Tax=unclassified Pedobacter TaxID=2628915 RepID=UPI001DA92E47|nr:MULTISPECIES: hypothetical protein [unclassified Pedobacter]CAH0149702.1 hypothetical protein SRABI36_00760 [Pedobacter sp. Bi36]CAH0205742.1 hypothetical protein SRABI126_01852 [Pedobacter sp. Bi126]CAH0264008.1 hypothetical protein SRABI27_03300 [Pedobacter sp. Bi27]